MICPKCHCQSDSLACRRCTAEAGRAGYIRQQTLFLPNVLAGKAEWCLVWMHRGDLPHVRLMNEASRSFCWMHLEHPAKKEWVKYKPELRREICPQCLKVLAGLEETMKATAQP